jgi:hypothetical protein
MKERNFSLLPFPKAGPLPDLKITGSIARRSNTLAIRYLLIDPLRELGATVRAHKPDRKDALWKKICFEFFLGEKTSDRYWEFNLSPAGHWNVYRFNAYRQGMQEEEAFASLPFCVRRHLDVLQLSLELELDAIVPEELPLKAAISAVIKHMDGRMTYWALAHPGPEADFHLRDGFIIEL